MKEKTFFAPSKRSSYEEIVNEFNLIGSQKFFTEIFGAMTGIGAVIDNNRQVVYANDIFLKSLGIRNIETVLGKRPGEVLSCIHAAKEPSGCGTAEACVYCGAVNTILESQKTGSRVMGETRISTNSEGKFKSYDFNVTSTPITLSGNKFYVVILQDISDEKRRYALERIFFHDLLNTAGVINSILTILKEGTAPEEAEELIRHSEEASRTLIEEILMHRQLVAAESGDLHMSIEKLNSVEFLHSVVDKISFQDFAVGKTTIVDGNTDEEIIETDKVLLQRVLSNLMKNALEATPEGGIVKTGCKASDNTVTFWIQNSGIISKEVQMQIFQRSFSTKGKGRGIGTYSVRLLTENYLKGRISFVSNEYEETIFTLEINRLFPSDNTD